MRKFYEVAVRLQPSGSHRQGVDVVYECGDGTRLMLYEWPGPRTHGQTVAHVVVPDVADTVPRHYAGFHGPDDNVIGIPD